MGYSKNPHQQQALNPSLPQPVGRSSNVIQSSSPLSRTSVQQGSAQIGTGEISGAGTRVAPLSTMISGQSPTLPVPRSRIGLPLPANPDGFRALALDQRGNAGGTKAISGAADCLTDLLSEQKLRSAGRMRGSVAGQVYSAVLSQVIMQQNHGA